MSSFTLRTGHLAPFADAARARFEAQLAEHLRRHFPEAGLPSDPALLQGIREQASRAAEFGMQSEHEIAVYVTTALLLGPDFPERFPEAARVLRSAAYSADQRLEWLDAWTQTLFLALEE